MYPTHKGHCGGDCNITSKHSHTRKNQKSNNHREKDVKCEKSHGDCVNGEKDPEVAAPLRRQRYSSTEGAWSGEDEASRGVDAGDSVSSVRPRRSCTTGEVDSSEVVTSQQHIDQAVSCPAAACH